MIGLKAHLFNGCKNLQIEHSNQAGEEMVNIYMVLTSALLSRCQDLD